jgi:hypothetical protein|nr:MAG TPA: hypothetical protein [Caudoviricetes sp.]DAQ59529.1 MAG TPA: hypothetical protein [Caudoviricetes sp.]DAR65679.1 MAG TPA: hypothetical protein [Caudoviricetes sp.]DAS27604.1 MAG TPA: hypothetical protein [Caudoviricetes sp.]DAU30273.1 MAG TPA: hypothetical protein [Caudoviricetes sp.]
MLIPSFPVSAPVKLPVKEDYSAGGFAFSVKEGLYPLPDRGTEDLQLPDIVGFNE